MSPSTRAWLSGLRTFAASRRDESPPALTGSPAQQAAERMILAVQLSSWLSDSPAILAARRAWVARLPGQEPADDDPAFVITTSPVGIAVADQQLEAGSPLAQALADRAVAVTELEYRLWCIRNPDDAGRHITIWNWIKTRVPPQRYAEFARHPLGVSESYWLHRAGIAGAGVADRRDCHLWKWNGRHASLLEAGVVEQGVADIS